MRLDETIAQLSAEIRGLGPGDLAELRRMDTDGPGVATYWHLATQCGFLDSSTDTWMCIVRIMAILSPKGDRTGAHPVHDPKRRLGAVLCDGGDPGWGSPAGGVRPSVSEQRIARFLAEPPTHRATALERLARMLAARRDPARGINCTDIARLLLFPHDPSSSRDLAREYYRRLDSAVRKSSQEEHVQ